MKRSIPIFFLVLLSFCVSILNAASPAASIVLSNPFVTNNLILYTVADPNNEPYTIETTIGGLDCRQIPGSKYAYFNANDATILSTQNNLIFTITYYDQGTDNLFFQYNATGGNDYQSVAITKTGTNAWITATIALTDASFRNAQNNACDFRIGTTTGYNNYIREVTSTIGTLNPVGEPVPSTTGSAYSEFTGKSVAGYQAWFTTGTAASDWFHWAGGTQPSVGHLNFEVYPDVTEYAASDLTQTGFANLGNNTPSKLFNSSNATVIDKHFTWMKTAGIDGVGLQRFINGIGSVINNSPAATPLKVKAAAEATNRIFYVCYDISSSGLDETWADIIKFDWVYNIEQSYGLTGSPAYATVNNKPVVELWGTGFTGNHPGTEAETIDLINFLKARGCYVIGGVPTYWRTENNDSKPSFLNAYKKYDMISPWSVGRFGDNAGATNFKNNLIIPDKALTDQLGIAYLPVVFPGFSWSQWNNSSANAPNAIPRNAGNFWWQQASNIKSAGISSMYFAMFDEYDEGTAIMKAATDYTMLPTDQYFVTTSADGIWTSSDFYLRLAGAGTELLKGIRASSSTVPIPYSEGPTYHRNSFEQRLTTYNLNGTPGSGNGYFKIDPCFYNDLVISNTGISSPSVAIVNNPSFTKSGLYSVMASGTPTSSSSANYYYQVSKTKIGVKSNMQLSFWKYSVNALGQYTSVDLLFQSGKRLSSLPAYTDSVGYAMTPAVARGILGRWQKFTCQIGVGILIGDTIIGIIIGYDNPSASGSYTAYFDDIIIEDAIALSRVKLPYGVTPWPIQGKIEAEYYDYGGEGIAYNDSEEENKLGQFRTQEAVDIEATGDTGGGYDIGWIESGEWLEYTVNVQTAGIYSLQARVASGNAGTKTLHVEMNGTNISGPISTTSNLGWQTYETVSVTTAVLSAGIQTMRIAIDAGGFNLNYVNFILSIPLSITPIVKSTGVEDAPGIASIGVYPNPVQSGGNTNIHFVNQPKGKYQIRLYNSIGQFIFDTNVTIGSDVVICPLNISNLLPLGCYQLEIISDACCTMQKIMIE